MEVRFYPHPASPPLVAEQNDRLDLAPQRPIERDERELRHAGKQRPTASTWRMPRQARSAVRAVLSRPALSLSKGPARARGPVLSLSKEPVLSLSKEPVLSLSKEPALSLSKGPVLSLSKELSSSARCA